MIFSQTVSQFIQGPSRKRPQAVINSSFELHADDTLLYFGRNNVWELESSVTPDVENVPNCLQTNFLILNLNTL